MEAHWNVGQFGLADLYREKTLYIERDAAHHVNTLLLRIMAFSCQVVV